MLFCEYKCFDCQFTELQYADTERTCISQINQFIPKKIFFISNIFWDFHPINLLSAKSRFKTIQKRMK
jgi:hypothetical protein